jgi:hypothetical protein
MESEFHRSACGGYQLPDEPGPSWPCASITRVFLMKRQYLFFLHLLLIVSLSFASFGCAHEMEYKPKYIHVPVFDPAHKFDGKCAVYTSSRDDSYVYQGYPSSAYGSTDTYKIPLGLITKNAAIRVFGAVCKEVSRLDSLDGKDYDVAIYPSPTHFDYFFNERGFLRLVITPGVVIDLQITVFDSSKDVIFSKSYDSGVVNGKNIYIPVTGWENVNAAVHKAITELLSKAAEDIVVSLKE